MKVYVVASFDQRNHLYEFDAPTIKIELVTFDAVKAEKYKEKWGEEVQLIEYELCTSKSICLMCGELVADNDVDEHCKSHKE